MFLFTKKTQTSFTIMLVYVDDVILAGNSLKEMKWIKQKMHQEFKIKDLEQLKYFLGIEVAHSKLFGILIVSKKILFGSSAGLINVMCQTNFHTIRSINKISQRCKCIIP